MLHSDRRHLTAEKNWGTGTCHATRGVEIGSGETAGGCNLKLPAVEQPENRGGSPGQGLSQSDGIAFVLHVLLL
jgi:hypothetical protein